MLYGQLAGLYLLQGQLNTLNDCFLFYSGQARQSSAWPFINNLILSCITWIVHAHVCLSIYLSMHVTIFIPFLCIWSPKSFNTLFFCVRASLKFQIALKVLMNTMAI